MLDRAHERGSWHTGTDRAERANYANLYSGRRLTIEATMSTWGRVHGGDGVPAGTPFSRQAWPAAVSSSPGGRDAIASRYPPAPPASGICMRLCRDAVLPCERGVLSARAIRTPRSPVDPAGGGGTGGAGASRVAAAEMPSERMGAPRPRRRGRGPRPSFRSRPRTGLVAHRHR